MGLLELFAFVPERRLHALQIGVHFFLLSLDDELGLVQSLLFLLELSLFDIDFGCELLDLHRVIPFRLIGLPHDHVQLLLQIFNLVLQLLILYLLLINLQLNLVLLGL